MQLTLNISDDLKPEELGEIVTLAKEEKKTIGQLLLESARAIAASRKALNPQPTGVAA